MTAFPSLTDEEITAIFAYVDETNAATAEEDASLPQALVFDFTIEDWYVNWSDQLPVGELKTRIGPINIGIKELNTLLNRAGKQSVVIVTENTGTLSWTGVWASSTAAASGSA